MVGPYRGLFDMPGVKGFVIAGFFGRLPMSMLGIGVVVLVSELTHSYATAGAVAATVSLAFAVGAPVSGRLADRFGQARVLVPLTIVHAAALVALMLCAGLGAPRWTLFATGVVVGGAAVSLGGMVRARWSHLLGGSGKLHAAFSFESVADEVIFVTGPALVTGLATTVNLYAGLIVALVSTVIGSLALAFQRRTQPPARRGVRGGGTPITIPGVMLLSCVFLAMGSVFGSVDLITVAFAREQGALAMSGVMLACFAGGSMVSGLWYGSRVWKISLRGRFVRSVAVFALGLSPIALIGNVPLMAVALFVAGLAISPTIITGYMLVERLVPPHLLTEGMAWVSTSVGLGVALGAWAAGRLTDAFGASNAYAFSFGCALLALAIGAGGSSLLRVPKTSTVKPAGH
ncbi:MFS family permease [Thermocatellispora tengchongensis]|uniref:MFS family permease n=1 Tax=Thermocatellispora tengchongensis TaxID=1073253 RepID=A0A840P7S5_9ACTN|nr:MFS transporter [Thermocatellispora tengchongensis]MBB5135352.1 MFS family permease [Thermocatellispora tengchongensis]